MIFKGRVQGVGFRHFCCKCKADEFYRICT
ncbi:MAG: acylphosphatase [Eubacterium sp.]